MVFNKVEVGNDCQSPIVGKEKNNLSTKCIHTAIQCHGKPAWMQILDVKSPEEALPADIAPLQAGEQKPSVNATAAKTTKVYAERKPAEWKNFGGKGKAAPEFNFVAPEIDFQGLNLTAEEKKAVEEKVLEKFKTAMKVMDNSIADASLDMVREKDLHPELLETLNKFSRRYLDVYKAYVEVLQEEKEPFFSADIGVAKSVGYTHAQIKALVGPSVWYQQQCSALMNAIDKVSSTPHLAEGLIYHLSKNDFNLKALDNLSQDPLVTVSGSKCTQLELHKALTSSPEIAAAAKEFCQAINTNAKDGPILKDLKNKFFAFDGRIEVVEQLKEKLAACDLTKTIDQQSLAVAVEEELKGRIADGTNEPGYISPADLIEILEGKHEDMDPAALLRHELYFIYKSKGIANEIAAAPEMVKKVNAKLAKNGWQLDNGVCEYLHKASPNTPVFKLGTYALENHKGLRSRATPDEVKASYDKCPKFTFADGERVADGVDVHTDELNQPYRFKLSKQEEMAYLKLIENTNDKEFVSKLGAFGQKMPAELRGKADPMYFENAVEALKKSTEQPWIPGKHFWKLNDSSGNDSPYLKAVDALGLPRQAGISGSTDQTLTMAGIVGITSEEEINRLRLMYLGWMTSCDDHSVDEILTSAKTFGIPYTPAPDYYKQIYPQDERFVEKVAAEQKRRGLELPDYYLSHGYVEQTLAAVRREKEASQAKAVADKLASNSLFMKALQGQSAADDIFEEGPFEKYLNHLDAPKKPPRDNGKIKYTYNPLTKQLEPHQKPSTPFYTGTKKTAVTLLPTNGKILPYNWDVTDNVGLLFDRAETPYKEKYVFTADALTDNKWWRRFYTPKQIQQPGFQDLLAHDVKQIQSNNGVGKNQSFDHLRVNSLAELADKINQAVDFQPHNEILASLSIDGVVGVFAFNKKVDQNAEGSALYTRLKGIANKVGMKLSRGVDVPLFVIDQAQNKGLELYSTDAQIEDLRKLKENAGGEFDAVVEYLVVKTKLDRQEIANLLRNELADLGKHLAIAA